MLLELNDISINFGPRQVLDQVSLKITKHSRIGLIGANGAGKSTLLKCITQELSPTRGTVTRADNIQIKCLTQNPELTPGNTLEEELYSVFTEIHELKSQETKLCESLEYVQDKELEKALEDLSKVQQQLDLLGASTAEAKIHKLATGLGFSLDQLKHPVDKFSGGWQMRINLAKVLLQEADVILMDEPTNHLDMEACEWLEEFLRGYPNGIVVVSHDRHFLDQVVTEVAELERGKLSLYSGNYSQYVEQRAALRGHQSAAAQRQQKQIKEQMEFVNRFRASARKSTQAKSRERQLAKMEIIDAPKGELKKLSFKFPLSEPSGREVCSIKNISKSFEGQPLYKNISAELEWTKEEPQRVFILGANGCGKTTLFKMLMGLETPDSGEIKFGHRVNLGYYAQHQLQILDPGKTVFKTLEDVMPPTPQGEIRGILGRFLFSADQVFKEVRVLSGGEKARLAIAKLMVGGPNTLLLDEPTNHLDTSAKEAIEDALYNYQGTVICISHDRYLIQNHATQIWEFDQGSLITFNGSYDLYLEKRKELIAKSRALNTKAVPIETKAAPTHHERHQAAKQEAKQIKTLEKNINQLTKQRETISKKITDPKIADDYKELEKLSKELETLELEIQAKESEWLELSSYSS